MMYMAIGLSLLGASQKTNAQKAAAGVANAQYLISQNIAQTQEYMNNLQLKTNDQVSRYQAMTNDMISRSQANVDLQMRTSQAIIQAKGQELSARVNASIERLNGEAIAMEMNSDFNRTMASNMVKAAAQGRSGPTVSAIASAAETQMNWDRDYAKTSAEIRANGYEGQATMAVLSADYAEGIAALGFADIPLAGTSGAPLAGTGPSSSYWDVGSGYDDFNFGSSFMSNLDWTSIASGVMSGYQTSPSGMMSSSDYISSLGNSTASNGTLYTGGASGWL